MAIVEETKGKNEIVTEIRKMDTINPNSSLSHFHECQNIENDLSARAANSPTGNEILSPSITQQPYE